jgi:hypothetical protein
MAIYILMFLVHCFAKLSILNFFPNNHRTFFIDRQNNKLLKTHAYKVEDRNLNPDHGVRQ